MVRYLVIIQLAFFSLQSYSQENKKSLSIDEISISYNRILSINSHVNPQSGFGLEINSYINDSEKIKVIFGLSFDLTHQFNDRLTITYRSFYRDVNSTSYNFSFPLDFRFRLVKKSNLFIQTGVFLNISSTKIVGSRTFRPGFGADDVSEVDEYLPGNVGLGISLGVVKEFKLYDKVFFVKPDCKIGLDFLFRESLDELSGIYGRISIGIKI